MTSFLNFIVGRRKRLKNLTRTINFMIIQCVRYQPTFVCKSGLLIKIHCDMTIYLEFSRNNGFTDKPLKENSSSLRGKESVRSAMIATASSSVGRSSLLIASSKSWDRSQIIFSALIKEGLFAEKRSFFIIF